MRWCHLIFTDRGSDGLSWGCAHLQGSPGPCQRGGLQSSLLTLHRSAPWTLIRGGRKGSPALEGMTQSSPREVPFSIQHSGCQAGPSFSSLYSNPCNQVPATWVPVCLFGTIGLGGPLLIQGLISNLRDPYPNTSLQKVFCCYHIHTPTFRVILPLSVQSLSCVQHFAASD